MSTPPTCKFWWQTGPPLTTTAEKALKISYSDWQVKKHLDVTAKEN